MGKVICKCDLAGSHIVRWLVSCGCRVRDATMTTEDGKEKKKKGEEKKVILTTEKKRREKKYER